MMLWSGICHAENTISGENSLPQQTQPNESPREKPLKTFFQKTFWTLDFMNPWFSTDESLYRFVSRDTPLRDADYVPSPLMPIAGEYIDEAGRVWYLRSDARQALGDMARVFQDEFGTPLIVISGYRSAAYQRKLWERPNYCTETLCALPWRSEHQLWLAVDLFDATTDEAFNQNTKYRKYVSWLKENAHLYGWHQSYQKWVWIDGYMVEPWHWRYVWIDMATRLHNLGWTYTEYVEFTYTLSLHLQ